MMMMKKEEKKKKKKLQLPPGSMGWPYIGETLQLYSQHPNAFFSSKQKRYLEAALQSAALKSNNSSLMPLSFD
jgi:(+)-abscisic acid 8'-hydroxylase